MTQQNTGFDVVIQSKALDEATESAFRAATEAARGGNDNLGSVFAQVMMPPIDSRGSSRLRIRGVFLERKYAEQINAILLEWHREHGRER